MHQLFPLSTRKLNPLQVSSLVLLSLVLSDAFHYTGRQSSSGLLLLAHCFALPSSPDSARICLGLPHHSHSQCKLRLSTIKRLLLPLPFSLLYSKQDSLSLPPYFG